MPAVGSSSSSRLGSGGDRHADLQPLPLAVRQRRGRLAGALAKADHGEQLALRAGRRGRAPLRDAQIVRDAQGRKHRRDLEFSGDPKPRDAVQRQAR